MFTKQRFMWVRGSIIIVITPIFTSLASIRFHDEDDQSCSAVLGPSYLQTRYNFIKNIITDGRHRLFILNFCWDYFTKIHQNEEGWIPVVSEKQNGLSSHLIFPMTQYAAIVVLGTIRYERNHQVL